MNGSVFAWGNNGVGQLGDGTTTQRNSPVMVSGGLTNVTQVSAGTAFSHALLSTNYIQIHLISLNLFFLLGR